MTQDLSDVAGPQPSRDDDEAGEGTEKGGVSMMSSPEKDLAVIEAAVAKEGEEEEESEEDDPARQPKPTSCYPAPVVKLRKALYYLLEDPGSSWAAKVVSIFILGTIIFSILCFVLETMPEM